MLYSLEEAGRYSMNVGVGAGNRRPEAAARRSIRSAGVTGFSSMFSFGISRLNLFDWGTP